MEQKGEVLWFNLLMTAATLLTGLLAGGSLDRYVVQVPAWGHLSKLSWAEYTRYAEFGNGLIFYPFEVLGSFMLLFTTSAIILIHKNKFRTIALPAHIATIFAILGVLFTFYSFPIMLSIQSMGNNEILVQHAFDRFHFWGLLRAISQLMAFFACAWVFVRRLNDAGRG